MTTFRDVVPTAYICHDDLKGKDVTLTIKEFRPEEMHLRGQRNAVTKPVLYFQEAKKGLVVNVSINGVISKLYETLEIEAWIGKRITLYPTTDDTGGETKRVVRVRPAIPPPPTPKPAAKAPTAPAAPAVDPATGEIHD